MSSIVKVVVTTYVVRSRKYLWR